MLVSHSFHVAHFSLLLLFYVIPHLTNSRNYAKNRQQKLYKWTNVENVYVQLRLIALNHFCSCLVAFQLFLLHSVVSSFALHIIIITLFALALLISA